MKFYVIRFINILIRYIQTFELLTVDSPHQWLRNSALKTGRQEGPGSIPSFLTTELLGVFRGFLRNSRKYGLGSLGKTPPPTHTEGTSPSRLGASCRQQALVLQPINQPSNVNFILKCRNAFTDIVIDT